jgi:hypothetical protein
MHYVWHHFCCLTTALQVHGLEKFGIVLTLMLVAVLYVEVCMCLCTKQTVNQPAN